MDNQKEEEWRTLDIPYFEGRYSISSWGRLRSDFGRHKGKIHTRKFDVNGAEAAILYHGPVSKSATVHSLVALAFLGPRPKGFEINHKDGDRTNNYLDNLEYGTKAHNVLHAQLNGLYAHGEGSFFNKLTTHQVHEIIALRGTMPYRRIAELFSVSKATVSHIMNGRNWKHITKWPKMKEYVKP